VEEQWKPIEEFPAYEVSSLGRVRSKERYIYTRTYPAQIMKNFIGNNGCVMVKLRDGKKQYRRSVAKLVLLAFIGPPPKGSKQVLHIDSNQQNNALSNLCWDVRVAYYMPVNQDARQLFMKSAFSIADKFIRINCSSLDFGIIDSQDIKSEGLLKIWKNIDAFDPNRVSFEAFCNVRLRDTLKSMLHKYIPKKRQEINMESVHPDDKDVDDLVTYTPKEFAVWDNYFGEEETHWL